MQSPSTQWLVSFLTLADELHFGRAAQRLGVSRQSLAKRVRLLEDHVGVPLVTTTTRSITLTSAGEIMRAATDEAMAQLQRGIESARSAADTQRLRVAVSSDLPPDWLDRVSAWAIPKPDSISVDRTAPDAAMAGLRAGRSDLVLNVGEPDDLPYELVGHEDVAVVVSAALPFADGDAVRPGDLTGVPIVVPAAGRDEHRRAVADRLVGRENTPYVVAPYSGTITAGLLRTVRARHGAAAVLRRNLQPAAVDDLRVLRPEPAWTVAVTAIGRVDLPGGWLDDLAASLLSFTDR